MRIRRKSGGDFVVEGSFGDWLPCAEHGDFVGVCPACNHTIRRLGGTAVHTEFPTLNSALVETVRYALNDRAGASPATRAKARRAFEKLVEDSDLDIEPVKDSLFSAVRRTVAVATGQPAEACPVYAKLEDCGCRHCSGICLCQRPGRLHYGGQAPHLGEPRP